MPPTIAAELTELFKRLDVDGNGTIDFEEFKAGARKEPLLVKAFLAPVQQGSLATAPATAGRRQKKSGACAGGDAAPAASAAAAPAAAPAAAAPGAAAAPATPAATAATATSGPPVLVGVCEKVARGKR